jgi:hypothetical protein
LTPPSISDSTPNDAGESERGASVGDWGFAVVTELLLDGLFAAGGVSDDPHAAARVRERINA